MSIVNLIEKIGLYSPLIVIIGVWIVTMFSNELLKGITYMFLIICALVLRMVALKQQPSTPNQSPPNLSAKQCSMGTDIPGDNETLGAYVISYTMWYVCLPMFIINDVNWGLFSFFLLTLILNLLINKECIKNCVSTVITNVISGGLLGTLFSLGVYSYANNLSLINESSSSSEVCTAPTKQTFKCKVFKNGELVNEVTS